MATIAILASFIMAASATPIQEAPNITDDNLRTDLVPPPDVSSGQPLSDDLTPPATSTTSEDRSNHPTERLPDVSSDQPANNDTDQPATKLLPPPPQEDPMGPPPDEDPFDCNIERPEDHIYLNCSFVCQGDEAEQVPDGKLCSLNHTAISPEDYNSTASNATITGVCEDGQCVPRPTTFTVPTTLTSTATTTTTTSVSETSPQSSMAETTTTTGVTTTTPQSTTAEPTTATTESRGTESPASTKSSVGEGASPESPTSAESSVRESASPESPTSAKSSVEEGSSPESHTGSVNPVGERETFQQQYGLQQNNTPEAMP